MKTVCRLDTIIINDHMNWLLYTVFKLVTTCNFNINWFVCLVAPLCLTLCDSLDCSPPGSSVHGDSPDKNTGVGCHALLQGNFPTWGSNPGLPHCRWILYHLSHQGSPRILEWVAYPFTSRSSQPRNWTRVSCIAGGFFTSWATREVHVYYIPNSLDEKRKNEKMI